MEKRGKKIRRYIQSVCYRLRSEIWTVRDLLMDRLSVLG